MRFTTIAIGGLVSLTALTGCGFAQPARPAEGGSPYNGTAIEGTFRLPDTALTDNTGETYRLREDSAGALTVLFFGFTNCPDICPTTMADLARTVTMLDPDHREQVNVVFITADPQRDDAATLDRWLAGFDPSFTGLTGDTADIDAVAEDVGVSIERPENPTGRYQVGHGSRTLLFSERGESVLLWSYGTEPEVMAEDLELVLTGEE